MGHLDLEGCLELMALIILIDLGHIQTEDMVGNSLRRGRASTVNHGVIRIDKLDIIGVAGGRVFSLFGQLCLVCNNDLGLLIERRACGLCSSLEVGEGDCQVVTCNVFGFIHSFRKIYRVAIIRLCSTGKRDRNAANSDCNRVQVGLQPNREMVLEHILVLIIRGNIGRNSTSQLVVDYLPNPGIAHVLPVIRCSVIGRLALSVIENLLIDRRNAGLLSNGHGVTTHDSENRGGTSVRLGRIRKTVRYEEVVAIVRTRPRIACLDRIAVSGLVINHSFSNRVQYVARSDSRPLGAIRAGSSSRNICGKPICHILGSYGILCWQRAFRIRIVLAIPYSLNNGLLSLFANCPLNVRSNLAAAVLGVNNLGLEDLISLERIVLVGVVDLIDRDAARRTISKRHGHRGHDAAEAQRRREAGRHCQAGDVLAHTHLLFLCFLLEFCLV